MKTVCVLPLSFSILCIILLTIVPWGMFYIFHLSLYHMRFSAKERGKLKGLFFSFVNMDDVSNHPIFVHSTLKNALMVKLILPFTMQYYYNPMM